MFSGGASSSAVVSSSVDDAASTGSRDLTVAGYDEGNFVSCVGGYDMTGGFCDGLSVPTILISEGRNSVDDGARGCSVVEYG